MRRYLITLAHGHRSRTLFRSGQNPAEATAAAMATVPRLRRAEWFVLRWREMKYA